MVFLMSKSWSNFGPTPKVIFITKLNRLKIGWRLSLQTPTVHNAHAKIFRAGFLSHLRN